jgi:AcrR family transcriptional regulator
MTSKNEKIFRISLSIFALETAKGHLGWKVTELEKKSKVSRTLIYRYFGKNKAEIFKNGLEIFLSEFYGFADDNLGSSRFSDKIESARRLLKENRDAVIFYQKWRLTDSPIKDIFIKTEETFRKKLKKMFPHLSSDEILMVHACMHGVVTSPFLEPKDAKKIFEALVQKGLFQSK